MEIWGYLSKISIVITIVSFIFGFFCGRKFETHYTKNEKNLNIKKNFFFKSNNNDVNQ